jgi:hypothetical protein
MITHFEISSQKKIKFLNDNYNQFLRQDFIMMDFFIKYDDYDQFDVLLNNSIFLKN